jgi:demethylmenaquinone methyltransferase/2-methoxy-6-polyprenyl-1,4-benzoquinol methylase
VLATLLLTALPDYERVVREAYRVLRPGGRFVVLDGQPFQHGLARLLNPVVVRVLALLTNWYPSAAVHEALEAVFDDVSVETFDAGALYLAVAQKGPEHDSTGDTMRGTTG